MANVVVNQTPVVETTKDDRKRSLLLSASFNESLPEDSHQSSGMDHLLYLENGDMSQERTIYSALRLSWQFCLWRTRCSKGRSVTIPLTDGKPSWYRISLTIIRTWMPSGVFGS